MDNHKTASKAARMAALIVAREQGWLEDLSLNAIAKVLAGDGEPVNRSTILRDLRMLDEVISLRNRLVERLRNLDDQ